MRIQGNTIHSAFLNLLLFCIVVDANEELHMGAPVVSCPSSGEPPKWEGDRRGPIREGPKQHCVMAPDYRRERLKATARGGPLAEASDWPSPLTPRQQRYTGHL